MGCVESKATCHICFDAADISTSYKDFHFFLCEDCSMEVVMEVANDWALKHKIMVILIIIGCIIIVLM